MPKSIRRPQQLMLNNSTNTPKGIPALPDRRSRRAPRVDYASLTEGGSAAEPGPLASSQRAGGCASPQHSDEECGPSSDEDVEEEEEPSDGDEVFEGLSGDEQAADAADGLLEMADAALQDQQQQRKRAPKEKTTDARYQNIQGVKG